MRLATSRLLQSTFSRQNTRSFTPIASRAAQRWYSIHADHAALTTQEIDATRLSIQRTLKPKDLLPSEDLVFGRNFTGSSFEFLTIYKPPKKLTIEFTDHMLSIEWTATDGWLPPRITPYQNLSLDPASCVFHYAFECFEGMKAYKDKDGNIRLFRPDRNMERFNSSAARIALPTFDTDALTQLIARFTFLDERFIPK